MFLSNSITHQNATWFPFHLIFIRHGDNKPTLLFNAKLPSNQTGTIIKRTHSHRLLIFFNSNGLAAWSESSNLINACTHQLERDLPPKPFAPLFGPVFVHLPDKIKRSKRSSRFSTKLQHVVYDVLRSRRCRSQGQPHRRKQPKLKIAL